MEYDQAVQVYRLFGVRVARYPRDTVFELQLKPADTVIELGCGTGPNFWCIQHAIGPTGTLVAVHLTDARLRSRRRAQHERIGER